MTNYEKLQKRLDREHKARLEAEHLLEAKSQELYEANQGLKAEIEQRGRMIKERTHELNNALREAERANRSKSDFVAVVSHEMRTPLNVVIGMSRLLSETSLAEDQKHYLQQRYNKKH